MTRPLLTRNLVLLALASFFTDVSSHIVFPLVPLFLASVLQAGGAIVGVVEGAAETVSAVLKGYAGHWSDRFARRKPFVVAGYAVSTLVKLGFAFATSWPIVLLARASERIGKGLRSAPRDALIVDEATPGTIGRAFGFQRAMDASGALIGALTAWFLIDRMSFETLFLWAMVPGVFGILAASLVREKRAAVSPHPARAENAPPPPPKSGLAAFRALPHDVRRAVAGCALFAFGQFGIAFFLLAATTNGLSHQDALLLYVLFNATNAITSMPAGRWSDRVGRFIPLMAGYALFAAVCVLLAFDRSALVMALGFALFGIAMALVDGTQRALVADLAPKNLRATAMGAYYAALAFVALPGGFIAGALWDRIAPSATFVFGAVFTTIAAITLSRSRPGRSAGT
jgi:MFS family permease